ncbi:hypothetical protein SBT36_27245, partial [Klebsiella pneumoniae]|uniref:hypothetical protein n=1 Tax=Klebsiella pneumoniae TaxID=573 RepID=UPI00298CAC49
MLHSQKRPFFYGDRKVFLMYSYYDILVSFLITFLTVQDKFFFLLENDEYKILISAVYSNRQEELKT